MKRTVKLLSLFLMLCLLVGIAAVSAFAASNVEIGALMSQQIKPSSATFYSNMKFSSGSNSEGNSTVAQKQVDVSGNDYVRYYGSGSSQINTAGSFVNIASGNTSSSKVGTFAHVDKNSAKYDYSVIDLDFGTDRYRALVGYKLNTTTTAGAAVTNPDGSKSTTTTYTYRIVPSYALYTAEQFTEENIKADIKAAYDALSELKNERDIGSELTSSVVVTVANGVTTTTTNVQPMQTMESLDLDDISKYEVSYEEAVSSKDLALYENDQVYVMGRYWQTDTQTTRTDYSLGINYKSDGNGDWSFYADGKKVAEMSDVAGKYDHITFITKYSAPAEGKTVGTVTGYVFVNGTLVKTLAAVDVYSFGIEATRATVNGTNKTYGGHSFAIANAAVNYYAANYTSGDAYGIDDFFTSGDYSTKSLSECTDVVYNKNYISPNGYLRVNTALSKGTPVSHPDLIAAELLKINNGSTLFTTIDVLGLDVPEGVEKFNIECGENVTVTLSEAARANRYALVKSQTGYTVKQDNSDITVYLKWLDIKGNHITTTPIFYGEAPDASSIVANSLDEATDTIYYASVSGWTWDLEGEVGIVTSDIAEAGSTVTMTPVIDGDISSVTGATFYIGVRYDDTLVTSPVPASNGTFTKYVNGTALTALQEVKTQTNANTLVLLSDFTGEAGEMAPLAATQSAQVMTARTTINFDLNGHTFIREGIADTFGTDLFRLNEGCTLNIYSTKAGGKIVMGNLRKSAANLICQSAGIANVTKYVNEACLSVGDIIGKDGSVIAECGDNFTYIGANILIASGDKQSASYDANATLKDDKKITVNMNGGYYYTPFRTSYGMVCVQCPDVVLNVDGVTIVNAYQSSCGLFSDYKDYAANTVATVKNSKIYSMIASENDSGDLVGTTASNIINILNADSSAYFENCVLIGKLVSNFSGKVEIGVGNTIVDLANLNFETNAKISFSAGVNYVIPLYYPVSYTVKHPRANGKWAHDLDLTISDETKISGVADTTAEADYITAASFKTEAYTEFDDIIYAGKISVVTYDVNNVPDIFGKVEWRTVEGDLIATTVELIGSEPLPPEEVLDVVGASETCKWYVKSYKWASEGGLVVEEGVNVFTPSAVYTADIRGIKANVTLFEDVVYNLYLPASDKVSNIVCDGAVISEGTTEIGGAEYIALSVKLAVDDFEAKNATVSYTVDGNTLSYDLIFDVLAYATVVGDRYACGSEEAALVYEMLSYKDAVARSAKAGYTAPQNLTEYMYKHSGCKCTETAVEPSEDELAVDYSAITEKGVTGIAYVLTLGDIGMAVYTDGVPVDSVSYTDDFGRSITHTLADGGIGEREGYYLVNGVSAAHINNVMTVSVGGATGTYSLAKYIENNPDVEVAKNLYKYALASEDYKYIRESESDKSTYNKMQSVLLIGQSNMTSSNNLYEAIQIEDDRLFMMRNYGWVKMQEPLHTGSSLYGAGIGATFGKAFVETFDVDLGLIPAAKGGTTLNDWRVGGDLYNNAMAMAKAAQQTSEICAILWHQGEGDQNNQNYAALLQVIFDAMIEELGLDPDKIVIITGELFGTRSDAVHMPQLIELGKHYKNYGIAQSDGLTVRDVTTHFDAPSMRVFGYRYFDIFYNLLTGKHYYFNQDPNYYKAIDE